MYRLLPYTLLFVVVALLQTLFFDNLSVSILLSPLIYVAFIVLLPLQASHFSLVMSGVVMGVVMDMTMGLAGINTIATLFIAFVRPYILNLTIKREVIAGGGVPSELLLGGGGFARYMIILVAIHHVIFFSLESLSLANITIYLLRFCMSVVISIFTIWLISRVFVTLFSINRK